MKIHIIASLALVSIIAGCSIDPTTGKSVFDKAKAQRIAAAIGNNLINDTGKIAAGELAGLVSQVSAGSTSKADLQQGAAEYAWKSISSIDVAGDLQNILLAAKADPQVAQAAATTFNAINPQTTAQKNTAVNVVLNTISTAAQ